jgi:hypothetical protein
MSLAVGLQSVGVPQRSPAATMSGAARPCDASGPRNAVPVIARTTRNALECRLASGKEIAKSVKAPTCTARGKSPPHDNRAFARGQRDRGSAAAERLAEGRLTQGKSWRRGGLYRTPLLMRSRKRVGSRLGACAAIAFSAALGLAAAQSAGAATWRVEQVRKSSTATWPRPSPAPTGLTYDAKSKKLLVSDGEVDEGPLVIADRSVPVGGQPGE